MASSLPAADEAASGESTFCLGAPPTIGDEQITALQIIMRAAAGELAEVWTSALNTACTLDIEDISLCPVVALDELAPSRASLTLATLDGFAGQILMVIPVEIGLIAVDLMLGGSGRPAGPERTLSPIDVDLLTALTVPSLDSLGESLGQASVAAVAASAHPAGPTTDASTIDLTMFDDTSAVVRFVVQCGETTASWMIAITSSMAVALTGAYATAAAVGAADEVASFQDAVRRRIVDIPLHAIVEFPPIRMRSTDLIALAVDDVIDLGCPIDGWLRVVVDGEIIANARAARSGDRLACQIVATTTESSPHGIRRAGDRQGAL